jgi:hypothetical protein
MRNAAFVAVTPPRGWRKLSPIEHCGGVAMRKIALVLMLGLAACAEADTDRQAGPVDMQGWRFASGKAPTRAEYAAVVAACEDGAVKRSQGAPLEACLLNLGLKRAP